MGDYEDGAFYRVRFKGEETVARLVLGGDVGHVPAGIEAWLLVGSEVPRTTDELDEVLEKVGRGPERGAHPG